MKSEGESFIDELIREAEEKDTRPPPGAGAQGHQGVAFRTGELPRRQDQDHRGIDAESHGARQELCHPGLRLRDFAAGLVSPTSYRYFTTGRQFRSRLLPIPFV